MQNNIGIIIQARMGSLRLPSKVILPFYQDKTIFDLLIEKLQIHFPNNQIILATSSAKENDILEKIASGKGISVYRGSENDVLLRFINAADNFNINKIIRVCSDNPFLDIEELKRLINYSEQNNYDYVSFIINGVPSIKTHFGFWTEYVSVEALKKVAAMTNLPYYHEHVTNFIYENSKLFKVSLLEPTNKLLEERNIRMTLDTKEDFDILSEIYNSLAEKHDQFGVSEIITFLNEFPDYIEKMSIQIKKNEK